MITSQQHQALQSTGTVRWQAWVPLLVAIFFLFSSGVVFAGPSMLESGFADPPRESRPTVWWYMGEGPTTKEGITHDLEAYAKAGFGGVQWYEQLFGKRTDPVLTLSPEWFEMLKHAQKECKRLGLIFEIAISSGYVTGGKWIPPELAMQRLVSAEKVVKGPAAIDEVLPTPGDGRGYYRDIAVLAFKTPESAIPAAPPAITSSLPLQGLEKLADGNGRSGVDIVPPADGSPVPIVMDFGKPVTARSLTMKMTPWVYSARAYALNKLVPSPGELEVSDDGQSFRTVCPLPVLYTNWGGSDSERTVSFPAVTGRYFRLNIHRWDGPLASKSKLLTINELTLGGEPRVDRFEEKAGYVADFPAPDKTPDYASSECLDVSGIIDLSGKLSADGRLRWDVPAGEWTVMRLGHVASTLKTKHGRPEVQGPECDKLSAKAAEVHFDNYAKVAHDVSVATGAPMQGVLIDSAEYGPQNWTPMFREEFKKRRGYDMTPYLPAMRGRVVGSPEISDRFLFDVRRTIADLLADNHFGKFQELAAERGMWTCAQAPGCGMGFDSDVIQCKGRAQMPMGEFWMHGMPQTGYMDIKDTSSGAHVYGRRIAASEAFTEADLTHSPEAMLARGDSALLGGINRFAVLAGNHQPWDDRKPGISSYWRAVPFHRHNTWWALSTDFWSYWSRSCFMLQQGLNVADVCYSVGEDVPSRIIPWQLTPALPKGFSYDACSAEAIVTRMKAEDGRIVLPDGMSYRVLVLPPNPRMTLLLVRKLKELVENGATVIAPRPTVSPSLADRGDGDAEIAKIAAEVWADCDGVHASEHQFGKGRVIWGKPLEEVLKPVGADCLFEGDSADDVQFLHRRDGAAEIYFVVNTSQTKSCSTTATFRVGGKAPEIWNPRTGRVERPAEYRIADGRTVVPMHLDQQEGVFVVFREPAAKNAVVSILKDGKPCASASVDWNDRRLELLAPEAGSYQLEFASGKSVALDVKSPARSLPVVGPWQITFPPKWGAPASVTLDKLDSWSRHPDPGVKFFSGTATYSKDVEIPQDLLQGKRLVLDLGKVKVMARVKLNGRDLGTLWKEPFRVDVTDAAKPGRNTLEIEVVNLWMNRLIGDFSLPENERFTWTTWNPVTATTPLSESGLLGPVCINATERITVK